MKAKYLMLLLFIGVFSANAQDPGMLDTTWYLRSITIDNEIDYVPPNTNFNLIITEDTGEYSVTADGIENGFTGVLEFDAPNETLTFTEIIITLGECMLFGCDYETLYFSEFLTDQTNELKTFDYFYFEFNNGTKKLRLTDTNGNVAEYLDYPMPNPDPLLFQTWYLYSTEVDLGEPAYYYGEDVPKMTIDSDFSFSGTDNCWELSGNFEYVGVDEFSFGLKTLNYQKDCVLGGSTGYTLELLYQFPDVIFSSVFPINNGGAGLYMETYPGFIHNFRNQVTLSVPEQTRKKITVYPNPASNKISISGLQNPVQELQILNITGSLIKTFNANSDGFYDVLDISQGIYFLKITSGGATSIEKLIKN